MAQERVRAAAGISPVLKVSFAKLLELLRPLWLVLAIAGDLFSERVRRELVKRFYEHTFFRSTTIWTSSVGACYTPGHHLVNERQNRVHPRASMVRTGLDAAVYSTLVPGKTPAILLGKGELFDCPKSPVVFSANCGAAFRVSMNSLTPDAGNDDGGRRPRATQ